MELNKSRKGFYFLISCAVGMLFLLGSWWLFLVFKLANKLNELNHPLVKGNLLTMVKWEGVSFISFLFLVVMALIYVYVQDFKRNNSMQAFFASFTHELKTPLASIKLQSQVVSELLEDIQIDMKDKEKLRKYIKRLSIAGTRLEDQLDNHLQLSRVERGAPINMRAIDLLAFSRKEFDRFNERIFYTLDIPKNLSLMADDYALQTILRNLIENSIKHSRSETPQISLLVKKEGDQIKLTYFDQGIPFDGDLKKLGSLFYKHNSPQGSGIGIYLIKKLTDKMGGSFKIESENRLSFYFTFPYRLAHVE